MNARTRSDVLALAGGDTASIAARRMRLNGSGTSRDEASRIVEDALEFAIEYARAEKETPAADLVRENEALKAKLDKINTMACELFDITEDA